MALIGFVKTFLGFFFFTLILLEVILKAVPWTRSRRSRKMHFAAVLFAASFAYVQGLAAVQGFVDAAVESLNRNPDSETTMLYLVGDFLPFMRSLGSSPSPESMIEVRRIAVKGPPCPAAMARRFLGQSADQESACRSK
jgi:hypothetical protein